MAPGKPDNDLKRGWGWGFENQKGFLWPLINSNGLTTRQLECSFYFYSLLCHVPLGHPGSKAKMVIHRVRE